jgi:ubiquinone/menaquinone biosynthesis C-methylase UbiE
MPDADYFSALQSQTGWGRVLVCFRDWIKPQAGWLTLDVGCGPGLLPALLAQAGCRSLGVDRDFAMFRPNPLCPNVGVADVSHLPFPTQHFDLITASNLLFLLSDPQAALREMVWLLRPEGQIATLNPSEHLTIKTATALVDERGLSGLARETLLNWAVRAEAHFHWNEFQTAQLFASAGLELIATHTTMGPGFARFGRGRLSGSQQV